MNSFNPAVHRAGFACKIQQSHDVAIAKFAVKSTTITWLSAQTPDRVVARLWELMQANVQALRAQIEYVGSLPANQRMFRLSGDLLPAYSHEDYMWFYFESDVVSYLESNLLEIGNLARSLDVRLSFHPGQFCVLASDNPEVVERSIIEFEYHCDIIRYMGYGRSFQDFKCNVHIGGKAGPEGIRRALKKLSREAHNCLTIENAEYSWGIEHSIELASDCALVLDIHHHWIASGEYISATDNRVLAIAESWRGVRPVIHYSISRENVLVDHDADTLPDLAELKSFGFTSTKLRAHSDYYWNSAVNEWAASFSANADIMCEAKQKNLASQNFIKFI